MCFSATPRLLPSLPPVLLASFRFIGKVFHMISRHDQGDMSHIRIPALRAEERPHLSRSPSVHDACGSLPLILVLL